LATPAIYTHTHRLIIFNNIVYNINLMNTTYD